MSSSLQLSDVIGLVQSALNVRMPITHATTSLFPKLSRVQLPLCSAPSPTFWDRFLGSILFCGRSDAWRNFHFRRPNVLRPPNLRCDRFCDGVYSVKFSFVLPIRATKLSSTQTFVAIGFVMGCIQLHYHLSCRQTFHFERPNVLRPPNLRCDRFCDGVHSINRQTFNDRQMFFGHQTFNDRQTFCDRSPFSQVGFAAVRTAAENVWKASW